MKKIIILLVAVAAIFFTQSCVKDEMYKGPATISKIEYTPGSVTFHDIVNVTAEISDLRGVTSAALIYSVNDAAAVSVAMNSVGGLYVAQIPEQADKAVVKFHIEAVNELGITAVSAEKTYTVTAYQNDYTKLVLNELNGNTKFIELYNAGDKDLLLEGVYIEKDGKNVWICDARTLAPGSYLVLWSIDKKADHPDVPEALFFSSGLSAKKVVRVQLFTPSGASIMDFNLKTLMKEATASYSYGPNDNVWYHATATPGAKNEVSTDPVEGLE